MIHKKLIMLTSIHGFYFCGAQLIQPSIGDHLETKIFNRSYRMDQCPKFIGDLELIFKNRVNLIEKIQNKVYTSLESIFDHLKEHNHRAEKFQFNCDVPSPKEAYKREFCIDEKLLFTVKYDKGNHTFKVKICDLVG